MNETHKQKARAACLLKDRSPGAFDLLRYEIVASLSPKTWPAARVELARAGRSATFDTATGAGGLDALFNALNAAAGIDARLERIDVRCTSTYPTGLLHDVLAYADVVVDSVPYRGAAQAEDIILACARAYLDALGRCSRRKVDTALLDNGGSAALSAATDAAAR